MMAPITGNTTSVTLSEHSGQLTTKEQRAGQRESVRSKIALYYIIGFFLIIILGLIIGWCRNFEIKDYKDILISISGILSGPLGFIIGFYFKDNTDN